MASFENPPIESQLLRRNNAQQRIRNNPPCLRSGNRHLSTTVKETNMNWDRIEGNWKQFKGHAKEQWGKLTDDQIDVIAGKRDILAGKIQDAYGHSKDVTEKQIAAWQKRMKDVEHAK